jgi:hypothetical protein
MYYGPLVWKYAAWISSRFAGGRRMTVEARFAERSRPVGTGAGASALAARSHVARTYMLPRVKEDERPFIADFLIGAATGAPVGG